MALRIPNVVEPPRPPPDRVLVDVPGPQTCYSPVSKGWIRDKLLVPRIAAPKPSKGTPLGPLQRRPYTVYDSAPVPWILSLRRNSIDSRPCSARRAPDLCQAVEERSGSGGVANDVQVMSPKPHSAAR